MGPLPEEERTEARTARAVLASGRAASRTSATALVADVDDCVESACTLMIVQRELRIAQPVNSHGKHGKQG